MYLINIFAFCKLLLFKKFVFNAPSVNDVIVILYLLNYSHKVLEKEVINAFVSKYVACKGLGHKTVVDETFKILPDLFLIKSCKKRWVNRTTETTFKLIISISFCNSIYINSP